MAEKKPPNINIDISTKWIIIFMISLIGFLMISVMVREYVEVLRYSSLTPGEREAERLIEELEKQEIKDQEIENQRLAEEGRKQLITDMKTLRDMIFRQPFLFLIFLTPFIFVFLTRFYGGGRY